MSEDLEAFHQRECREFEAKNVAHYSVLLQAWVDNRMEGDRTIVTFSVSAIGILVTILATVGVQRLFQIFLYIGASLGFLLATFMSLVIYRSNARLLERAIRDSSSDDPVLKNCDRIQVAAFLIGAFFSVGIGIDSAIFRFKGDAVMNENKKSSTVQSTGQLVGNSLHGIGRLAPENRSLDGISAMKPQAPVQTSVPISSQAAGEPAANPPASTLPADGAK